MTVTNTGLNNAPQEKEIKNLKRLCAILEQIRSLCQSRPIIVSSGFRSPEVNKKVGGSKTSAHLRGDAVDFTVKGVNIKEVFNLIRASGIVFDQLILEPGWIHLGLSDSPRKQCLNFDGKNYTII